MSLSSPLGIQSSPKLRMVYIMEPKHPWRFGGDGTSYSDEVSWLDPKGSVTLRIPRLDPPEMEECVWTLYL